MEQEPDYVSEFERRLRAIADKAEADGHLAGAVAYRCAADQVHEKENAFLRALIRGLQADYPEVDTERTRT